MWLLDLLFPVRSDESRLREVTVDEFLSLVAPRIISATTPASVARLSYGTKTVRAAIHEAKYHGSEQAFTLLAAVLAEYLRDHDEIGRDTVIVPVPLGSARRKERGFNQVEEVLKRAAGAVGGALDTSILERVRDTESQVSLPRERRAPNMRGAFRAAHPLSPIVTYFLVDDVLTTGATLEAAIDALKSAGAEHIIPIACAH
jgi:ComF family protein